MRKLLGILVILLMLLPGTAALAERGRDRPPREIAEEFLKGIGKGDTDAAIDNLIAGTFLLSQNQQMEAARTQIKSIPSLYGAYLDTQFIRQKQVGSSIVYLVYVTKYEQNFITWCFMFYRPKDRWVSTGFRWSDTGEGLDSEIGGLR